MRFAVGFSTAGALVTILSILLVGRSASMSLIHLLRAGSLESDQGTAAQFEMAIHPLFMPNISGVLYALGTRLLAPRIAFSAVALLSLYLTLWGISLMKKRTREAVAFSVAILCGLLVSNHLYIHDVTLLLLPIALVGPEHPRIISTIYLFPPFLFLTGLNDLFFALAFLLVAFLIVLTHLQRGGPSRSILRLGNDKDDGVYTRARYSGVEKEPVHNAITPRRDHQNHRA
jgi:hypothetical protein